MSQRSQRLRALVTERLTAAVEEIFVLVERTIAEYEEELSRCKEENQRNQQLLDQVLSPTVRLHRTEFRPPSEDADEEEEDEEEEEENVDVEEAAPRVKQEPCDVPVTEEVPDLWEPALTLTPSLDFSQIKPETFLANFSWQPPIDDDVKLDYKFSELRPQEVSSELRPQEVSSVRSPQELSSVRSPQEPSTVAPSRETPPGANPVSSEGAGPQSGAAAAVAEGPPTIPCQICGKKWRTYTTLRRHMNIHFLQKIYGCPICGRKFPREDSMRFHMALHTGEVSAQCRICRKGFARKSSLTLHMATHNQVKPFRCAICNKCFTQKGNLKVHMMSHTGERPYRCPHCDCAYLRKERLQKHLLDHEQK